MATGRPRTPTNILAMRGAFEKHPERARARKDEPAKLDPLGECPEELGQLVKDAWKNIVETAPPGVLKKTDMLSVELAAVLLAAHRCGELDTPGRGQLINLLGKFGMNPSDRSRVSATKDDAPQGKREKYLN